MLKYLALLAAFCITANGNLIQNSKRMMDEFMDAFNTNSDLLENFFRLYESLDNAFTSSNKASTHIKTENDLEKSNKLMDKFEDAINTDSDFLENILRLYEALDNGLNRVKAHLNEPPPHSRKRPEGVSLAPLEPEVEKILSSKIPKENQRYPTASYMLRLIKDRNVKTIVETGTSRYGISSCTSDGCSTVLYGEYAQKIGAKLYSVDISGENCVMARKACSHIGKTVEITENDSLIFLRDFKKGLIDFLYLDSYDYDENNPDPSQEHHEKEIDIVYNKLHKRSIVMVDDCHLPYEGKCRLVRKYLLRRGWKMVMNRYQQIFVYEE